MSQPSKKKAIFKDKSQESKQQWETDT